MKPEETRHERAFQAAQMHAARCRRCHMPVIDEEGNPGYLGEACRDGVAILREYIDAEVELLRRARA
jgi:hypothetical protein